MSDVEAMIENCSMRPPPGTRGGEAWADGCKQGYEWGRRTALEEAAAVLDGEADRIEQEASKAEMGFVLAITAAGYRKLAAICRSLSPSHVGDGTGEKDGQRHQGMQTALPCASDAGAQEKPIEPTRAVQWLRDAESYFLNRDTKGEDKAHWSNAQNAENCRRIAALLVSVHSTTAET